MSPRDYGIQVVWLQDPSPEAWEAGLRREHPEAVLAYAETPVNPTLAMVDLAAVAEIAHRHGAWLMVDNTFASPYCQRPLSLGADIVLHSTTKYLAGHGAVVGGVVVSRHLSLRAQRAVQPAQDLGRLPQPLRRLADQRWA